jgi:hypothetical protein
MSTERDRQASECPRCRRRYPWGSTVCPNCHVALTLFVQPAPAAAPVPVFETSDRTSVDIVTGLLESHGISAQVFGHEDPIHFGIGPSGFWRVCVRPEDELQAQAVLDDEIGTDPEGDTR